MRKITAIARNIIRLEFSEKSTLIFFLVLPVLFTFIIGVGLGGISGGDDTDPRIAIVVVDEDQTGLSESFTSALGSSTVVRPVLRTSDEAASLLEEEQVTSVVTIPCGFADGLVNGENVEIRVKSIPGDTALVVEQAIQSVSRQVSSAVAAARASVAERENLQSFESDASREAYFTSSLAQAEELLDNPPAVVEMSYPVRQQHKSASGFEQSSPGQLVTWVLITLLSATEALVNERLGGTFRRLVITPTSRFQILAGIVLGWLVMGIVQTVILIGFGAAFLNVNWGQSPAALALLVFGFSLSAVSFGVLLSTFAKTRSQAGGFRTLFGMLLAALGGAWWPLEITPAIYQTVVKILPTTWAMQGFGDIILRGQGLQAILPEFGVLMGFSVIFFGIAVVRFKFD